jgi:hypothetical protein
MLGESGVSRSVGDVGAGEGITYFNPPNTQYNETSNKEGTITKNSTKGVEYDRTNQFFVPEFNDKRSINKYVSTSQSTTPSWNRYQHVLPVRIHRPINAAL